MAATITLSASTTTHLDRPTTRPPRLEIDDVCPRIDTIRHTYRGVRPHEALVFERPLERYLAEPVEPHLSEPQSVQDP
jgi:hypothetical protein